MATKNGIRPHFNLQATAKNQLPTKILAYRGSRDWDDHLDPLHPWLRREIIKYGEFTQATYDALDFDSFSEYCGSCIYNRHKLFDKLGLGKSGYNVTRYLYAMSHIDLHQWLKKSRFVDTWNKDSNLMGFVAISDDQESQRVGRNGVVVVAWRDTVAPSELYDNMQQRLNIVS
ncbi:phospholipase A1-Igamma1, chloroplastic-like [Primulina huaijiensis]|uniref:phospholipase A1-Igamma1, chloroplastic-like n=1 Tax=Primulina huaijiensis TaxID=1492673 RepID=UPI003CC70195